MESSFEPWLESPTICKFLLYAAAATDENEPEYDSAQETSYIMMTHFYQSTLGSSFMQDQEVDELMRSCQVFYEDLQWFYESIESPSSDQ